MKRVLVTGASGFIGRQVLAPLLEAGYEVHAVSRAAPQEIPSGICWHPCNLLCETASKELIETVCPTHLLYLAWYAVPGLFWNAEENRLWLAAGRNLLEIFHRCGGVRAVFAGTCAEYEPGHELCVENQTPLCPVSLYGACKGELCQYATAFAEKNSVSMAWGRVFHLYGPHEPSQRFVPAVVRALLCQQEAGCTAGTQVRDFLHVCDVATAFVALLQSPVEGAVNIASGQPVRLAEMAQNIARQIGAESLLKLGALPMSAGDPAVLTAATHRLNQEVNWWPAISLEQGLAETIAWWRERLV